MEEIPTFYTELADKVLQVKHIIPHANEEQLIRALYDLYCFCFCLGAVAQHTEDDAKQFMKERNRELYER